MTPTRAVRLALVATLVLAVMGPPIGPALEARMFTHMLVQMPALLLAGGLLAARARRSAFARRWNLGGVPGLLAVSGVLTFWMLPIALDHAVASPGWDIAKAMSLVGAGAWARASWPVAPSVIQAFFVGNLVWMSATAGLLYQDDGSRLCNAYLQSDQAVTGSALMWLAVASGLLWMWHLTLRPPQGTLP